MNCVSTVAEYIRVLLKGQTGHLSVTASVNHYSHKHVANLPTKPSVSSVVEGRLLTNLLSRKVVQGDNFCVSSLYL